jgi:DNA-binding beta-propeller fold protein YncE
VGQGHPTDTRRKEILRMRLLRAGTGASAPREPSSEAVKLLASCKVGVGPTAAAFDSANGYVYVFNAAYGGSTAPGSISVLKSRCTVVKNIELPAGSMTTGGALDPVTKEMFVADWNLDRVYVVRHTSVVATIQDPSFSRPIAAAFDPFTGSMLVANEGGGTTILGGHDDRTVVGSFTSSACVDLTSLLVTPENQIFETAIHGAVCVFSASTYSWISNLNIHDSPWDLTWDSAHDRVVVSHAYDGRLETINPVTYAIHCLRSVAVAFGSGGIAYSVALNAVFVTGNNDVWVVHSTGGPHAFWVHRGMGGGEDLDGIVYDPLNGDMYIAGWGTNEVYVVT